MFGVFIIALVFSAHLTLDRVFYVASSSVQNGDAVVRNGTSQQQGGAELLCGGEQNSVRVRLIK